MNRVLRMNGRRTHLVLTIGATGCGQGWRDDIPGDATSAAIEAGDGPAAGAPGAPGNPPAVQPGFRPSGESGGTGDADALYPDLLYFVVGFAVALDADEGWVLDEYGSPTFLPAAAVPLPGGGVTKAYYSLIPFAVWSIN